MSIKPAYPTTTPLAAPDADQTALHKALLDLSQPVYLSQDAGGKPVVQSGPEATLSASAPALPVRALGDPTFQTGHNCKASFYVGSMANGISSAGMVITMGKQGLLSAYGSGGVSPEDSQAAIQEIQAALPDGPYAVNLLNSPFEPGLEEQNVELFINQQVRTIEASAYLTLTPGLVRYRASGLNLMPDGTIEMRNRVIAKLSRKEVARRFMGPPSEKLLAEQVQAGQITQQQANMAKDVPMADDITVEGDSGGHTDNRPLVCLIPTMLAEYERVREAFPHITHPIRIGAAGGISTPEAALAALMAGASYVVTGSINQACVEAGTSEKTRQMLCKADMADVIMAPSADMFEMGSRVQVLKRGTMFAMRASKLYEVYRAYNSIDEIPAKELEHLETKIFQRTVDKVWADTVAFFEQRNPDQITRANKDPKMKMALIFRWYLGLSSRWAINSTESRDMDFQVWCGPAMGTFNDWVHGTYLAESENRRVADVNLHILTGAAYLYRLRILEAQGIRIPQALKTYHPEKPLIAG